MRSYRILKRLSREFYPLMELSRLPECREFVQHGDTTVLLHCVAVAYFSLWLVKFLHNARADVELTPLEEDIIGHHMFPLNLQPPRSREAAVICLVDKGCGIYETFGRGTYPGLRRMIRKAEKKGQL